MDRIWQLLGCGVATSDMTCLQFCTMLGNIAVRFTKRGTFQVWTACPQHPLECFRRCCFQRPRVSVLAGSLCAPVSSCRMELPFQNLAVQGEACLDLPPVHEEEIKVELGEADRHFYEVVRVDPFDLCHRTNV